MLEQIVPSFVVMFAITFIFGRLTRNAKIGNAARHGNYKFISMPNWMYGFIGGSGFLFCCLGLGIIWFVKDQAGAGYAFICIGLFFLVALFIIKTICIDEIKWNNCDISGSKGQLALQLLEYNWEDARQIGYQKNGHLYLTFADNNKMFILTWNVGWVELIEDIQIYAPHVKIDPKIIEAIQP